MTLVEAIFLFLAALMGGGLNSVAGGGSFFVFPALLFVGVSPISANATNTVALWPGSIASVGAYRRELVRQHQGLPQLIITSVVGSIIGAQLLLGTQEATFARLVPYLLLLATLIFAVSGPLTRRLRARQAAHPASPWLARFVVPLIQLATAIYGGFFGGGIGILMLATLALTGMDDIHEMNAIKTLLATLINGVAVVAFIAAGVVRWPEALVMIAGATVGGYGGASLARRLQPIVVRRFVIVVGMALTLYFFWRG
jgi:uncharacterized membrane protein YfcA